MKQPDGAGVFFSDVDPAPPGDALSGESVLSKKLLDGASWICLAAVLAAVGYWLIVFPGERIRLREIAENVEARIPGVSRFFLADPAWRVPMYAVAAGVVSLAAQFLLISRTGRIFVHLGVLTVMVAAMILFRQVMLQWLVQLMQQLT